MTELAVEAVREGIRSQGVRLFVHRVPQTHISHILASAWRSSGIVIGAPTYEYKMFPPMAAVLDELGRKRVMNRKGLYFGSFGWSGGAQRELQEIIERLRMRWEMAEAVQFNGAPGEQELRSLRERAAELARSVKTWAGSCEREEPK
jgi:anaerobic nitric oxide reductase flavorubredoxin